jgi:hypothetical protein
MPYLRFEDDAFDDACEAAGFQYDEPEGDTFDPAKLLPVSKALLDRLVAAGATGMYIKYDGGNDEGFSHPLTVLFGPALVEGRPVEDVAAELGTTEFLAALASAAANRGSMWYQAESMFADHSNPARVVGYAFDDLAFELATSLLGEGFGTGEYSLYGAFTADFRTNALTDHSDVERPADLD